ncbi:MAG: enoyl-CoA hydratase/isomerase family protein [Calditrichaceae bacterium]
MMTSDSHKYLKSTVEDGRLNITLNRPEKRNALNKILVDELKSVLKWSLSVKDIRTIIIRGAGKAFCSGADLEYLKELKGYSRQENIQDSLSLADLYYQIYSHPKPVIAAVDGPALAGGCGLASVCDFIIATDNARFGYPEVKIGFVAALVSVFLIRQVGERKARELLLTGKIISAKEAVDIGLINKLVSVPALDKSIDELAGELGMNSSMAISTSKQLLSGFTFGDIESELNRTANINAGFRETEDFIEGIQAFIEKRKPKWILS